MDMEGLRRAYRIFLAIALLLTLPLAARASQAATVALVTSVSGTAGSAVEPFTELHAGSGIALAPDTEIEFVHYASCETVRVRGGRLSVSARAFAVSGGGRVLEVERTPCPTIIALGGSTEIGGLLVRADDALRIPLRPRFVTVGSRAGDLARVVVSAGRTELLAAPLKGSTVDWPENAAPLVPGQEYAIALFALDGKLLHGFHATAGSVREGVLTLLRVD